MDLVIVFDVGDDSARVLVVDHRVTLHWNPVVGPGLVEGWIVGRNFEWDFVALVIDLRANLALTIGVLVELHKRFKFLLLE